jgi:hypothetical protein
MTKLFDGLKKKIGQLNEALSSLYCSCTEELSSSNNVFVTYPLIAANEAIVKVR